MVKQLSYTREDTLSQTKARRAQQEGKVRFKLAATKAPLFPVWSQQRNLSVSLLTCDGIVLLPDDTAIKINEILLVKFQEDACLISGS